MRFIIALWFIIFSFIFADNETEMGSNDTQGSFGTVTINGEMYNQVSIRPTIPFGKLTIQIDTYLYYNSNGIYSESWNFSTTKDAYSTIIDKIYNLKWGKETDNFHFTAGALSSVTLGNGILVDRYSNIMEYPQVRQVGLNLNAKLKGIGVEVIHSNFKEASPGVMGIRGSLEPISNLSIGLSYVTDLDQNSGLQDTDDDNYPDYYDFYPNDSDKWDDSLRAQSEWDRFNTILEQSGLDPMDDDQFSTWFQDGEYYNSYDPTDTKENDVSGVSFDVTYSLSNKLKLKMYSQGAYLIGEVDTTMLDPNISLDDYSLGWGFVPLGFRAKLGPLYMKAEYRMNSRRFVFNYWDKSYDLNRVTMTNTGDVLTRENQLYNYGKLAGYYIQADATIIDIFNLSVGYQGMSGEIWDTSNSSGEYKEEESNTTFLAKIGMKSGLIPKVGDATAYYQQSNVPNPFEFQPNSSTVWGFEIGYEIQEGVVLLYKANTSYIYNLDTGEYDPVKSIQIETKVNL